MTGLLSRFRDWLGSLFGGDDEGDDGDDAADEPRIEGSGPAVTHRDDRPLETPDVSPPGTESATLETDDSADGQTGPEGSHEAGQIPDAGARSESDAGSHTAPDPSPGPGPGPVSIPDAEDGVEGGAPSEPGTSVEGGSADATAADDAASGSRDRDDPDATAADDASGFECAVCGTAVDEPVHSCPLCRSTEIVPATESAEGES